MKSIHYILITALLACLTIYLLSLFHKPQGVNGNWNPNSIIGKWANGRDTISFSKKGSYTYSGWGVEGPHLCSAGSWIAEGSGFIINSDSVLCDSLFNPWHLTASDRKEIEIKVNGKVQRVPKYVLYSQSGPPYLYIPFKHDTARITDDTILNLSGSRGTETLYKITLSSRIE